jgi:hypothetical protein
MTSKAGHSKYVYQEELLRDSQLDTTTTKVIAENVTNLAEQEERGHPVDNP